MGWMGMDGMRDEERLLDFCGNFSIAFFVQICVIILLCAHLSSTGQEIRRRRRGYSSRTMNVIGEDDEYV